MKPHLFRFGEFVVERHCLEFSFDEGVCLGDLWGEICFNFIFCVCCCIEEIYLRLMSRKVTMRDLLGTNFMMGEDEPFLGAHLLHYPMSCRGGRFELWREWVILYRDIFKNVYCTNIVKIQNS